MSSKIFSKPDFFLTFIWSLSFSSQAQILPTRFLRCPQPPRTRRDSVQTCWGYTKKFERILCVLFTIFHPNCSCFLARPCGARLAQGSAFVRDFRFNCRLEFVFLFSKKSVKNFRQPSAVAVFLFLVLSIYYMKPFRQPHL